MNFSKRQFLCSYLLFLFIIGCEEEGIRKIHKNLASLTPVKDCYDLEKQLKQREIEEMKERLDENLKDALERLERAKRRSCRRTKDRSCYMDEFGKRRCESAPAANWRCLTGGGEHISSSSSPSSKKSASQYSKTNTQVEDVDEADFLKNDGGYIYILADNHFQIIDAWPPQEAKKISTIKIEGEAKRLYVHKDRAVIYSSLSPSGRRKSHQRSKIGKLMCISLRRRECTYGYDCEFTGDGNDLKITIFDISNRKRPILLREIDLNGSYLNSRRIGDAIYTVVIFPEFSLDHKLSFWPEDYYKCGSCREEACSEQEIIRMFRKLEMKNKQKIMQTNLSGFLPTIKDTRYIGGFPIINDELLNDCRNFYISKQQDGKSFLTLLSFDIDAHKSLYASTIIDRPGAVYASSSSLYIATRHYYNEGKPWFYRDTNKIDEVTTVHKFKLDIKSPSSIYVGSGIVKGRILNQFSMDEYNGYFRIATTMGRVPDPNVHSTISILKEIKGELKLVGIIDNIAPTEDIRSARFNGDKGFIVTFKKTDPLFVLDLSNPKEPKIAGELKIPGFSTYIHMLDDKHILSIGYDADDQGDFAWFTEIMLQIFDVSNLSNPRLIHKEVIGTRGSTSDAATNHLAFNFFRPKNLLAIPMVICEGGEEWGGSYGDIMTFSGLMVYRVTIKGGFSYLGGVSHEEPETEEHHWGACSNWWTESNSKVKRSIFMDDYVYSIALDLIKINHLDHLGFDLASIDLNNN
jgi:uncharacterized secreted protein with C-terminal beta-propeller domain